MAVLRRDLRWRAPSRSQSLRCLRTALRQRLCSTACSPRERASAHWFLLRVHRGESLRLMRYRRLRHALARFAWAWLVLLVQASRPS